MPVWQDSELSSAVLKAVCAQALGVESFDLQGGVGLILRKELGSCADFIFGTTCNHEGRALRYGPFFKACNERDCFLVAPGCARYGHHIKYLDRYKVEGGKQLHVSHIETRAQVMGYKIHISFRWLHSRIPLCSIQSLLHSLFLPVRNASRGEQQHHKSSSLLHF